MVTYDSFEQGSDTWHQIRMGLATSSQFKRLMAGRGGDITYMAELISQRLTNKSKELYWNESMRHGTETEGQAIANYELITQTDVKGVSFVKRDDYIGCSPDGLVGDDGLVEVKCPDTHTHIKWMIQGDKIPSDHLTQVLGSLWITERKWADFISFDPRLEYPHNIFIVRATFDDHRGEIDKIADKVLKFKESLISELVRFNK